MTAFQVVGWAGNACFFSRFFVQWWFSERARRSVAPRVFWWLSLCGATALSVYAVSEHRRVMLAGYAINACIYSRNLRLASGTRKRRPTRPLWIAAFGLVATLVLAWAAVTGTRAAGDDLGLWIAVGVTGQALFSLRFVVQWILSERAGASHFPRSFWWISLAGNALLLAYAIHLGDPVFIAGFVPGPLVQVRNLILDRRSRTSATLAD